METGTRKGKRRRWKPKWPSHGVEGVNVDSDGEGRHERGASQKNPEGKAKGWEKKVQKFRARSGK